MDDRSKTYDPVRGKRIAREMAPFALVIGCVIIWQEHRAWWLAIPVGVLSAVASLRFRMCAAITCAIATSADSRAHPFGSSLRASWCWLPQTNAECRVPTVRQPSPKRRVVQPALLRRTSATQMTGGATLQLCL